MREEETTTAEPDAPQKKGGGVLVAAVAILVSVAAGSAVGIGLVGPKVAAAPRPAAESTDEGDHGKHGKGHGDASKLYAVESLVVNPSGTAGTRFLIATVTVELDDAKSVDLIKARDAATRDALLHVLGSKTIEQLSEVAARDSLKTELSAAIGGIIGAGKVRKLFLPQWVLQ